MTSAVPSLVSIAGLLALGVIAPASAAPLASLKNQGLDAIYGEYAPRGNCAATPRLAIDAAGFAFQAAGRTIRSRKFEYAASYMGQAYDGITAVFFPFPRSDQDFGSLLMFVNDDEKPGVIRFENDVVPGQAADPLHAALTSASPFLRCGSKPPAEAIPAPAKSAGPGTRSAKPLEWANLPAMLGRYPGGQQTDAIDLFERGSVAAALRALLGTKLPALRSNLTAASPLQRQGPVYYLSGNAAHQGGVEQAYVLIDPAQRAVQVGLWEKGKLRVFAPTTGGRIPLPADIQALVERSPPETATALPGSPWELLPVAGRAPVAHVAAAASPGIESFTLFCDNGRPTIAMLLIKPLTKTNLTLTWNFAGGLVNIPVQRGNAAGTFWQGSLAGSPLLAQLMQQRGNAMLRIDGRGEGEASLINAPPVLRSAMKACARL